MFSFSINTAKQGNTISSFNNFSPSTVATDSTHSEEEFGLLITVKNLKTNNLINLCYSFV